MVDTDYSQYMSVYSCIESAEFRIKGTEDQYIHDEEAWSFKMKGEFPDKVE